MASRRKLFWGRRAARQVGALLLAGLLTLIPIIVTYLVLRWLFFTLDDLLQPILNLFLHREIPGVGLVALLVLLLILGGFTSNVLGRRIVAFVDSLLGRTPVVRYIYSVTRQVTDSFRVPKGASFRRVALVDFPRPGVKSVAFVTGPVTKANGERLVPVMIPTAPTPTSGFLLLVPESEVVEIDMTIEEAFRMVVSGGIITPDTIALKSGPDEEVAPSQGDDSATGEERNSKS